MPTPTSRSTNVSTARSGRPILIAFLLSALAAWAAFTTETWRLREVEAIAQPALPVAPVAPVAVKATREVQRAAFFDSQVVPEIVATDRLNREAAERCVRNLRRVFRGYREGVEPFVHDLTSLSTRLGIVRRMPGNWWREDGRIEDYVRIKFETHLFSQERLVSDIAEVLDRFRDEVDANQKRMLVQVQASLETADLPEVRVDQYEPFFRAVVERLQGYSAAQGTNSVQNALTVLLISEAGSYAAVTIVAGLLSRFGTAAAVSAATGAGATAGASAAGAGGGSLAGPVGTVVGLGVGLAAGLVIDWWMTDRFEEEMTRQMTGYLRSLEQMILTGSAAPPRGSKRPHPSTQDARQVGLMDALPSLCDGLEASYRDRFFEQIVTPTLSPSTSGTVP